MCSGWPCRVWSRLVASVCGDDVLLDCFVVRLPLFMLVGLLEGVLSVAGEGEIYLRVEDMWIKRKKREKAKEM